MSRLGVCPSALPPLQGNVADPLRELRARQTLLAVRTISIVLDELRLYSRGLSSLTDKA